MEGIQLSLFGKMYPEPSAATAGTICKDDGKAYFTYRCLKCGMYRESESIERK